MSRTWRFASTTSAAAALAFLLVVPSRVRAVEAEPDVVEAAAGDADPLYGDDFDRELEAQPSGFWDPFEPVNRGLLHVNRFVDRVLLDPVTNAYDWIVPERVEPAIRRMFQHFATPAELLNDLLQFRFRHAGGTAARFIVNTGTGPMGLYDFARCNGLVHHHADFGQTLASWGIPSGPYLILPVFGPSNVRDGFGDLVDGLLHPARYFLGPAQQLTFGSGAGLATREKHYKALNELEKSTIDFYAALRNAYYQARMAEIVEGVDRDIVVPPHAETDAPCSATLDGAKERVIGGPVQHGLPADPVSRWRPTSVSRS
jgi:phospholipid-binding lipoprotein MlaA